MLAASVWRQRRGSLSMTTARPSYVHGASNQPLLGDTVGALLDRVAAAYPERPALVARAQGVRLSYRQFHAEVERVAAGLLALGLERGDRVGIWAPNRAEWVVLQFAAPKAGLILVNINPAYRTHELEYSLNKVACSALVLPRRWRGCMRLNRRWASTIRSASSSPPRSAYRTHELESSLNKVACSALVLPRRWRGCMRLNRRWASTIRSTSSSPP